MKIFHKVFICMFSASIVTGTIALCVLVIEQSKALEKDIHRNYLSLAGVMSKSIEAGYLAGKWPFETLAEAQKHGKIVFWLVAKPDGEVILASNSSMWGKKLSDEYLSSTIKSFDIRFKGETVRLIIYPLEITEEGKNWIFCMGYSLEPIIDARNLLLERGLISFAVLTILVAIVSFLLSRDISEPITKISKAALSVARGDLDQYVTIRTDGEILQLADNFNKMVRDLKKQRNELKKLLKQKDEFIYQLGHDLKTPLTPISALLPLIIEREKDPKQKELLDVVLRNVNYMKKLVMDTLELAKLNAPSTKFDLKRVNLSSVVERVLYNNKPLFMENGINAENKVREDIFVKADELRLEEVLNNLISNAVKCMPDGGNLTVSAEEKGKEVVVHVKDTGIGLTSEEKERIFDEFYKVDRSRHDLGSTGLGLTICKRIIEKHGGKIWAESEGKNKGTTISFTLPACR
ncbi:MAG: HAMP domain-containing histidine kinase [Thermoplasmata archaeon]|nr:HAMP domain-containing histidine kinase [Thermoplasmata archaeon]